MEEQRWGAGGEAAPSLTSPTAPVSRLGHHGTSGGPAWKKTFRNQSKTTL